MKLGEILIKKAFADKKTKTIFVNNLQKVIFFFDENKNLISTKKFESISFDFLKSKYNLNNIEYLEYLNFNEKSVDYIIYATNKENTKIKITEKIIIN